MRTSQHWDVAVIGSGFGGSVAALRLREKGYSVVVIEAGRRFHDHDFAKTSWRLSKFLYAPRLGLRGIQRIHVLKDVLVLAGAGVGGGSLVYANTLYVPPETYFRDAQWVHITDWHAELKPFYSLAERMLGVALNPRMTPSDEAMLRAAQAMGKEHTFHLTPVGVHFGQGPGVESADPYFGGAGPRRKGCTHCGECMTGCRHDAKNTLVKNYLYLAEKIGAVVLPNRTVTGLSFDNKRWTLRMRPSWLAFGAPITLTADQVVVAAGTFNTQKLLHSAKASTLPKLSDRLGYLSRTNSEALVGTIMPTTSPNFSEGVAITSSFHPDDVTHVEPVRYGKGSNTMGILQTLMTDGETASQRRRAWWRAMLKHPRDLLRILDIRRWSERAVIALVMQNVDSSVRVMWKRGRLTSQQDETKPNATYISAANETARAIAREYNGIPAGHYGDLIGAPFTAHFVGGCVIGDSIEVGVIDPYHRVWNYPTMHVVDGSAITANLGVNPSLTITAQAERAFSMWPNRADADPRPAQGSPYQSIKPIMPSQPAVPAQAPAALNYEN